MFSERVSYILTNWPEYGIEFILPYFVLFFGFKNLKFLDFAQKVLLAAFCFWVFFDLWVWYYAILKENNYWISAIQNVFFGTLVVLSFTLYLKKRWLFFLTAFLILQLVTYFIPEQGYEKYLLHTANRLVFLIFAIVFFFKTMEEMLVKNLTDFPWFWIFAGFLIYSSCTVITFLLSEFTISISNGEDTSNFYKTFNLVFSFILYALVAFGFYKTRVYYELNG